MVAAKGLRYENIWTYKTSAGELNLAARLRLLRSGSFCPFMPIDDAVHHIGEQERSNDVEYRVLFQEHGRQDDTSHQCKGQETHGPVVFEPAALCDGQVHCDRVVYVDAREQVRRRVRRPEPFAERGKYVVVREVLRAQVMSVRVDRRDDQENGHPREQECAQLVVIRPVMPCGVDDSPSDVGKPQQIRDDEVFTEWDVIIQRHMHNVEMRCDRLLHVPEPDQIDQKVRQDVQVLIFFVKIQQILFDSRVVLVSHKLSIPSFGEAPPEN